MKSGPSCMVLCIDGAYDGPQPPRRPAGPRPPIGPADLVRMAAWSEPRLASLRAWNQLRRLSSSVLTIERYWPRPGLTAGSSCRRSLPPSIPTGGSSSALVRQR